MIVMSGDWAGQFSRSFTPFSKNHVIVCSDLGAGALSCWNISCRFISVNKFYRCRSRYVVVVIIFRTGIRPFSIFFRPSQDMKPQNILFPPPNFNVVWTYIWWNLALGSRQIPFFKNTGKCWKKWSGSSSWTVLAVSLDKFGSFSGIWHGMCDDLEAVPGHFRRNSFGCSDHFLRSRNS